MKYRLKVFKCFKSFYWILKWFIKYWKVKSNQSKKRKILIVFDDMIADMLRNKKLNPIVT